ncbi:MAG: XRE family transcriptional regulator [Proteobacteria bacterium]|nr:XRE family transcriptional regulator [Pseudomonadota bacterium]
MARKLDDVMAALPKDRQKRVQARAMELVTLKDLRQAVQQTQEQMAAALGVRQDTISRLEKRSDMLLSTMRHYVESMGGKLELVAKFPDRPPVVIDRIGGDVTLNKRGRASRRAPLPPGAGVRSGAHLSAFKGRRPR